ncbi:MAG: hypothetical protein Q4C95_11375 [Planctomycetia bacterium]|nr:hypothetical protein [Planctomycetia bacterium]
MIYKTKSKKTVLGLDIGANSLGWALVQFGGNNESNGSICKTGVRIFQAGVDHFDSPKEQSKNEGRRICRGGRRRLRRLAQRKQQLTTLLTQNEMLPLNLEQETSDPYELRKKGLEEKLSLKEFGRVLYHLCQRRGFATARKTKIKKNTVKKEDAEKNVSTSGTEKKEEKKENILANISELADQIEKSEEKTVGAYFFKLRQEIHSNEFAVDTHDVRCIKRSLSFFGPNNPNFIQNY